MAASSSSLASTQAVYVGDGFGLNTNITLATVTDNNLAAANDPLGQTDAFENIIPPVAMLQGKVSVSGTSVTGTETDFENDVVVGQYLFYYDPTGVPLTLGKVVSVINGTSLTIDYSPGTFNEVYYGTMSKRIMVEDELMLRIGVTQGSTPEKIFLPYPLGFSNFNNNGFIRPNILSIQQYSENGAPDVALVPADDLNNTLTLILPWPTFVTSNKQEAYFESVSQFPKYVYFRYRQYNDGNLLRMNFTNNTMYRAFFTPITSGVEAGVAVSTASMTSFGYYKS